ncbi:tetraacyldisaccharide 4'-kinase [Oceanobacter kriegii]|uniref:tetraacyldisaccharide 4'-kinase n=1 Tax=Oceanobacter kriegii TaxID=64972 RepID=UPI00040BF995|nr:tetraacyldisaccharide 4'-kinase [Oceanobacter kriegii]
MSLLDRVKSSIEQGWYKSAWHNIWLLPLHWLFWVVVLVRQVVYALFPPKAVNAPVIVVGNVSVGGTGKTPLITWLVERAHAQRLTVGIVSRGYGGKSDKYPLWVGQDTPISQCGDEPWLLHNRLGCPVVVDPVRRRAVEALTGKVDIILSDDGLQHYSMPRVAEIVVVDAKRGLGNGWLLPVGPLREPAARLQNVDCVIRNGEDFVLEPQGLKNAKTLSEMEPSALQGQKVHAVAGIGNPGRFFQTLRDMGMEPIEHAFGDHHPFVADDLKFEDEHPIVMTEKDWVKCRDLVEDNAWFVPVDPVFNKATRRKLDKLLTTWGEKRNG